MTQRPWFPCLVHCGYRHSGSDDSLFCTTLGFAGSDCVTSPDRVFTITLAISADGLFSLNARGFEQTIADLRLSTRQALFTSTCPSLHPQVYPHGITAKPPRHANPIQNITLHGFHQKTRRTCAAHYSLSRGIRPKPVRLKALGVFIEQDCLFSVEGKRFI